MWPKGRKRPLNHIDITGRKFGRLTVKEYAGKNNAGRVLWRCQCDCGNEVIVASANLRNGHTQSCGSPLAQGRGLKHNLRSHGVERCFNCKEIHTSNWYCFPLQDIRDIRDFISLIPRKRLKKKDFYRVLVMSLHTRH